MTTNNELKNVKSDLKESIRRHVRYSLGKELSPGAGGDLFLSVALSLRDRMIDAMLKTEKRRGQADAKRLYYLSLEYLTGRSLGNNLYNLGLFDVCKDIMSEMGADLEEVRELENDAALGNGGLGRLAACFLDSLATLDLPGYGYGIHYEYGLFRQEIDNGYQKEKPDNWLAKSSPWEIERPDEACIVPVYGRIEHGTDSTGNYNPMWLDWKALIGVPYDIPVVGYGGRTANYLRLYAARSSSEFDVQIFNDGDYLKAVEQKIASETISKILYPSDSMESGRELRIIQEYFMVACSLRDIMRRYLKNHSDFDSFPDKVAIQMNDTHPSLAVAELMRLLVDEQALAWDKAWDITHKTLAYTNHTLMSEALERWPVSLVERVLPRHLQIIYEINRRFLEGVAALKPGDADSLSRMSLIEDGEQKKVRMAHLAVVGSHSVNGVSALHTNLLKNSLFADFYALWPERFNNKTNGVTHRRWLLKSNPLLAELITKSIGEAWITDSGKLIKLSPFARDAAFQEEFRRVKRANKERLCKVIMDTTRIKVNPDSLFDVQVKRIHEYKRQLLNVMRVVYEYLCLVEDQKEPTVPRTYIFAGKAAPGYWMAKQIIKLIHNVGKVVNNDPRTRGLIKVVFLPDYRVSLAEKIIPAADISEQISTAGMEASGTGNMKFALNGALTVGTLDGANIEIRDAVGSKNFFAFGLGVKEVQDMQRTGAYHPVKYYNRHEEIRRALDAFRSNLFCPDEPDLFQWIYYRLLHEGDVYFHVADFIPYLKAQEDAGKEYWHSTLWAKKAILNVSRMGTFSSDRTVSEYAQDVWHISRI